jgi:ABC-type multidrug transport system fused ATPase/permease subunit
MTAFVSVGFNYLGPFFLNRILACIGPGATPESRSQAYIYAALACLATVGRAQADLQHLWFGRRAALRARSELMAVIYDKTLKRRDLSGIVDNKKKDGKKDSAGENKDADEEPKTADVGKIVNLMSNDANQVSFILSAVFLVCSAPIEIAIASVFLYKLLGWSAFVGFVAIFASWPLNSYFMTRAYTIQKDLSSARDKRMSVINELITAIKFIKFFAWGVYSLAAFFTRLGGLTLLA